MSDFVMQPQRGNVFFSNWCQRIENGQKSLIDFLEKLDEFSEPDSVQNIRLNIHASIILRELNIFYDFLSLEAHRNQEMLDDSEI